MDAECVKRCALHSFEHLLKIDTIFWIRVIWTHSARKKKTKQKKQRGQEKKSTKFISSHPHKRLSYLKEKEGERTCRGSMNTSRSCATSLPGLIELVCGGGRRQIWRKHVQCLGWNFYRHESRVALFFSLPSSSSGALSSGFSNIQEVF